MFTVFLYKEYNSLKIIRRENTVTNTTTNPTFPVSYGLPVTRAAANENALDQTPWVLVFTGTNGNATFAEAAQAEYNNGKSYVFLDIQTGPC